MTTSTPSRPGRLQDITLTILLAIFHGTVTAGDVCTAERIAELSGWPLAWIVQIPFDSQHARVEAVSIGENLVVATTGDGGVHAYRELPDPIAGTLAWSRRAGPATATGQPADVGPSLVVFTRGSDVSGFDRETGDRLWRDHLSRMPSGPAMETDGWVFVPYGELRMLRLPSHPSGAASRPTPTTAVSAPSQDGAPQAMAGQTASRAPGRPSEATKPRRGNTLESTAPLLVDSGTSTATSPRRIAPRTLAWLGAEGMLVTLVDSERGWTRHELRLGSTPIGDLLHRGDTMWVAISSGDLVCVRSGFHGLTPLWRVALPARPSGQMLVDGDTLLISLGVWGVEARSVTNGALLWRNEEHVTFLTAGGGMAWWIDAVGRLSLIDLKTGSRLACVPRGRFQMPIRNTVNGRLYLATHDGVLASFSPPTEAAAESSATEEKPGGGEQNEQRDGTGDKQPKPADAEPSDQDKTFDDDPFAASGGSSPREPS